MIDSQLGEALPALWQLYAPVLRAKTSEFKALSALTPGVRRRISPILEFVPEWRGPTVSGTPSAVRKTRAPQTAMAYVRQMLQRSTASTPAGTSSFVYFGHASSTAEFNGIDLWAEYEGQVPSGSRVLPLVDLSTVAATTSRVARAADHAAGTIGIRIGPPDLGVGLNGRLRTSLRELGLSIESAHIVVDLQDSPEAATHSDLRRMLGDAAAFPSITVVAGTFPIDLTRYQTGVTPEPRREWSVWHREHAVTEIGDRFLAFGDFTTQHAHYRPSPSVPGSVSLRYTTDDAILVLRGKQSNSGSGLGYEQIHGHCRLLISRAEYDGSVFSDGDRRMYCWRDPARGPGNPEQWRTAGLVHHMTHVVLQLQSPNGMTATARAWSRAQTPAACV